MAKIKIISKEKEIEGTIQEKSVSPFGTSGHIIMAKKEVGKIVDVVIPKKAKYIWLLSEAEKQEIISICTKIAKTHDSKKRVYELEAIENIQEKEFELDNLNIILDILRQDKEHLSLMTKLQDFYNL